MESTTAAPKLVPFGKYLLLERVAVGGMAEVWLAKRVQADGVSELLAVKRILPHFSADEDFIRMFVDEARIAGQLQHPGIVPMHELGRIGQSFYIAMEYVWGRDLLQILRTLKQTGQRMSYATAAYIAARLCEALHYAHVRVDKNGTPLDLVHRDVSPQNVLVSFDGKVKLIDFGIAKASSRTTKTQAGTLKGKVGYMSPEQVRGLPVDARSDLFAVGTLLYEMITVRPLFARGNNFEAMNRVREADVPPIASRASDCPEALAAIVMKALAKEPADRFSTAQQMQRALTVFLTEHASNYERYDLANWLRRLYEDEFLREKARLDALDSIGRPAVSPVSKKHTNPVTSLEIASTSLFDEAGETDATQIGPRAPLSVSNDAEAPSEVFFHRDEVVRVGEANPEGHVARPLKAVFRPGKPDAVEAFRPPLVARADTVPEPADGASASAETSASDGSASQTQPSRRRTTLMAHAPSTPNAAAEPSKQAGPMPVVRLPPGRPVVTTAQLGGDVRRMAAEASHPEPKGRVTLPHHTPRPASTDSFRAVETEPIALRSPAAEGSIPFLDVSSIEVAPEFEDFVERRHEPRTVQPTTDDDEAFEDGGIREPLVPPSTVSRARIVPVSDRPPPAPERAPSTTTTTTTAARADLASSSSAITRALEQMALEGASPGSSSEVSLPAVDTGRLSGFALDPQNLNSQIIRQILGTTSKSSASSRRGEPTESFRAAEPAGLVAHLPTLLPRATTGDYVFFALVALLTVALGGTVAVTALYADSGATLEVRCVPELPATVIVDGAPRGRAPLRLDDLSPGQHAITVVAPGFEDAHRQIFVAPRESASIEIALRPRVRDASESNSTPPGVLPPGTTP